MHLRAGVLAVASVFVLSWLVLAGSAHSEGSRCHWDFDPGAYNDTRFDGWGATEGLTVGLELPSLARVAVTQSANVHTFGSWAVPAVPGATYRATAVVAASGAWSTIAATLQLAESNGAAPERSSQPLAATGTTQTIELGPLISTFGGSLTVVFEGSGAPGATLVVDSVTIEETLPPPTVVPTPTVTATASATPTASATVRATATATVAPQVFANLTNGDFEAEPSLFGWSAVGGLGSVGTGAGWVGQAGILSSSGSSTKWLQQAVYVEGGRWYEATARLVTANAADEAWVRLAWYATSDASGAQLSTDDSPIATSSSSLVSTGRTQAPASARSVRVRLVLRPATEGTMLAADDVTLALVTPPTPTPTPTATPTATPAATAGPTRPSPLPVVAAGAEPPAASPEAAIATSSVRGPSATSTAPRENSAPPSNAGPPPNDGNTALVRITEVMPDPTEPGADLEFEWIEVANLGAVQANLAGLVLEDNGGRVSLPEATLGAREVMVIAARIASVEGAPRIERLPRGISNGLGNAGDRLTLLAADGTRLDGLSWGSDNTYPDAHLDAPGAGRSIARHFADDGSLRGQVVTPQPSPGVLVDSVIEPAAAPASLAIEAKRRTSAWWFLAAFAGLLLVVESARRAWTIVRRRNDERARGAFEVGDR